MREGGVPAALAQEWEDAWNSHDLTRILAHDTDDIVFRFAKAQALVGCDRLHGKAALSPY